MDIESEIKKIDSALSVDLKALSEGKICGVKASSKSAGLYYPKNGELIVEQDKAGIYFNGRMLRGGVLSSDKKSYIDAKGDIFYEFEGRILSASSLCEKFSFGISDFKNCDFGINLANSGKEVALIFSSCVNMGDYTLAFLEIAKDFMGNLLKNNGFLKLSLINFYGDEAKDCGTFYDVESFVKEVQKIKKTSYKDRLLSYALINALKNFTKDNNLAKEIYLLSDGESAQRVNDKLLSLLNTLNKNLIKGESGEKNKVKVHSCSIGGNYKFLKNISLESGGEYALIATPYEFQKQLLTLSNNGFFDKRQLDNKIHSAKAQKIHDDNPPKKD